MAVPRNGDFCVHSLACTEEHQARLVCLRIRESFRSLRKFFFPHITLIEGMTLSQTPEFQRSWPARSTRIGFNDLNDGRTIHSCSSECFAGSTSVAAEPRWVALCIRDQAQQAVGRGLPALPKSGMCFARMPRSAGPMARQVTAGRSPRYGSFAKNVGSPYVFSDEL